MRRVRVACACLSGLLLAMLGAGSLHAAPAKARQLQIEAPRYNLDQHTGIYTYEDGKLTLGDLTLFASHLVLNSVTGQVHASGFVRVQNNQLYGTADTLEMNARTRTGTLHHARLYLVPGGLFIRAGTVVIHEDGRLELEDCNFTSCKPTVPGAWHLSASTVEMKPNDLGVAWNPVVSVGPMPVFWFPIIAWPTVNERSTGVLGPRISRDNASLDRFNLGWRLQVPIFLNLGYNQDLTLHPEVIQHRGLAMGLEYNYAFWPGQRGQFYLWRIKERNARDPNQENNILKPAGLVPPDSPYTRYRLDWANNQPIGDNGRLLLTYHDSSDGQVRNEYDHVMEYRPYHTYQASLTEQGRLLNTALTYHQQASFNQESVYATGLKYTNLRQIPQLLPSLTTHVGGRPFDALPLRLDLGLRAARFVAPESLSGNLLEAIPSVSLPLSLGGAFELRPSFSRRMVAYTGLVEGDTSGTVTSLASEGFDQNTETLELRTRLSRVYSAEGRTFEAIKHRMVPRLIYTEVQDVPQPFTGQLEPAHITERLFTIRLDNSLLGRGPAPEASRNVPPGVSQPEGTTTDLLDLNLIQPYNLLLRSAEPTIKGPQSTLPQESDPNHPWMPLQIELTVNRPQLQVSAIVHYHYQLHRANLFNINVTGSSEAGSSLTVAYEKNEFTYVTPDNQEMAAATTFGFGGSVPFGDTLTMGFNARINLVDGSPPMDRRLDTDGAYLDYHPACYSLRAVYSEAVTYTLENNLPNYYVDHHLRIIFDLSGLLGGIRSASSPPSSLSYNGYRHESAPASCHG